MIKPYYETELGKLYHGDCLEILPQLTEKIDAVITDPPYGIGFKYNQHDDNSETYEVWIKDAILKSEKLGNDGSIHCWFQAMLNAPNFHKIFGDRKYRIYAAAKNFVQIRPIAMQYAYDPVIVWWKEGDIYKSGKGRDYFVANTSGIISNPDNIEKKHPCPRPLDQIIELISKYTRPNGLILDPFLGSGTTAVACERLGRRWIGIEISKDYCDIAVKRIEQGRKQLKLSL